MPESGYDPVRRYARVCRLEEEPSVAQAYMPLSSAPGEVCQFDRSHEVVPIDGTTVTVKVVPVVCAIAGCRSHGPTRAKTRGWCSSRRGICDTMKTAVDTRIAGKERIHNRRFPQMCSHHPVACSPVWGWEQGEVENRVGLVCGRVFAPAAGDELR